MNSESVNSTTAAGTDSSGDASDDSNFPLWRFVTKLERKGKGGNWSFQCKFCNKIAVGSYVRVKAHLLKIPGNGISVCPKVTPGNKNEFLKLIYEVENISLSRTVASVPLPSSSSQGPFAIAATPTPMPTLPSYELKKRKTSAIEKAFNNECREHLRSEIARMFYASGLPFHFARSPYYINAFTYAANHHIAGFVPPGYNALRTTLLQKERANIERLLEPIKGTWQEKGVSIVTDGWTDAQRRPLINFMAVTESGPMFLRAVNCEGEYKDKNFIANLMKETIKEVGPGNVVQVITDNAPVCKAAGMLVEAQYPHIFWTPCVVHTLNLALKDICAAKNTESNADVYFECGWITDVAGDAIIIKNFVVNHSMRLAMYNDFVSLKLLSIAETRFASTIVMLKRFKLVKRGLQAMVLCDRWSMYKDDNLGMATKVKELILSDVWWDKVDKILAFTNPIYDMLRFADTDKPALHLIYEMWDSMIENVKKAIYRYEAREESDESTFYNVVYQILTQRWSKSSTPLHCMAHALNPRYYSKEWLGGAPGRVPPHKDNEISEERANCLRRYFPNDVERKKAILEFHEFSGGTGHFAKYDSLADRGSLDPKAWWSFYGASAPLLQNIALKLLGQPCSSSCSERNWSTYSFIHSIRRNKIQPQRAEDLVYVHTNLRLLSRQNEAYMKGETRLWDIAGDAFDPLDGAGELEIANLSLDEPDMEAGLCAEENELNNDGCPS